MRVDRLNVGFHLLAAAVSSVLVYVFPYFQEKYEYENAILFGFSFASFIWILVAVLIGPLHVLFKKSLPPISWTRLRGLAGIWASLLIFLHLYKLWEDFYGFSFEKATRGGSWHGYLEFGILHAAFLYIVLMGLTSNDWSRRTLGKFWKQFHKGIYFLFPAIAAAGVYEMNRIDTDPSLLILTACAGLIVPFLQVKARTFLKMRS